MSITHLQVVSIPVADQDRARAFYVETLGFEVRYDGEFGDGQRWIELVPPGAETSVSLVSWFDAMPPGSLQGIVLASDDVRGDYEALTARGLDFEGPVKEEFWGTFAPFSDPDGNGWILTEAPAGAPD